MAPYEKIEYDIYSNEYDEYMKTHLTVAEQGYLDVFKKEIKELE